MTASLPEASLPEPWSLDSYRVHFPCFSLFFRLPGWSCWGRGVSGLEAYTFPEITSLHFL